MNAPVPAPDTRPGGSLVRDVAVLLLVGAALGVTHNAYMLAAGPGRGLPWIKTERRVVKLEDLAPADPAGPTALATTTADPPAGSPATPAPGDAHAKPPGEPAKPSAAASDSAKAKPAGRDVPHAATPAAPKGTNGESASAPAQPAPTAAAPAMDVPNIPESREPIEAGLDVVRRLYAAKAALFLDARSPEEFAQGHIAGATNLPFDDVFRDPDLAGKLADAGRPIVTYCGGGDCDVSRNLAFSIIDAGRRRVIVFTGGLPDWQQAGLPVATGSKP
jgi:rhodanese-related sulfurtransferase